MSTTVFIADDQSMVREGFRALLSAEPDITVVGDAADGRTTVNEVVRLAPDVVLLDVRMPVMNGLEAAAQIMARRIDPAPRVLMLTTFDIDDYVYEALRLGASGFMLKDAPADELIRAVMIEEATRRRSNVRSEPPQLRALTPREREVLELIAKGLSNNEIAERLYLAEQTVKTHVGRVFAKLQLRDRAQAVVFAYESGVVAPWS